MPSTPRARRLGPIGPAPDPNWDKFPPMPSPFPDVPQTPLPKGRSFTPPSLDEIVEGIKKMPRPADIIPLESVPLVIAHDVRQTDIPQGARRMREFLAAGKNIGSKILKNSVPLIALQAQGAALQRLNEGMDDVIFKAEASKWLREHHLRNEDIDLDDRARRHQTDIDLDELQRHSILNKLK